MKKEKGKRIVQFEWKIDLNGILIIFTVLMIFWATSNNISSINQRVDESNQRIDGVYEILIKSDKGIVDMKAGIEARFTSIEKGLATIEIGISSLQPRDDSIKEDKPPTEITPYQEGESGPKTTPY